MKSQHLTKLVIDVLKLPNLYEILKLLSNLSLGRNIPEKVDSLRGNYTGGGADLPALLMRPTDVK